MQAVRVANSGLPLTPLRKHPCESSNTTYHDMFSKQALKLAKNVFTTESQLSRNSIGATAHSSLVFGSPVCHFCAPKGNLLETYLRVSTKAYVVPM